jgi:hypothetical protein
MKHMCFIRSFFAHIYHNALIFWYNKRTTSTDSLLTHKQQLYHHFTTLPSVFVTLTTATSPEAQQDRSQNAKVQFAELQQKVERDRARAQQEEAAAAEREQARAQRKAAAPAVNGM